MSGYYSEGSMKGSGIDNFEFEYGDFTCTNDECGKENTGVMAYGDDWGNWSVECEYCECEYTSGSRYDGRDE
jgi:hypothetical protein